MSEKCPECRAALPAGITCQGNFHQMLYWESEDPSVFGAAHHLMVLSYHLQHPSLYSPDGLDYALHLLVDFLDHGLSTGDVRARSRDQVDSGKRNWKIKATPSSQGAYRHPVHWSMTSQEVVSRGKEKFVAQVRIWASSILSDLRKSDNM